MVAVERIDTRDRRQVKRFIDLPFRLYADCRQWVPPIRTDVALALNPEKHPFYEHSTADFFLVTRNGRDVGRIAALENRNSNRYHDARIAQFYFFECEDDPEAAAALFDVVFQWARSRRLNRVVGPKGFSPFDGYGLLQTGFEYRQMMNMTNYNFAYYLDLVEALGFVKEVDFVSHYLPMESFVLDERIHRIGDRVRERRGLRIQRFGSRRELRKWAPRLGQAYNQAFVANWEYVPLTPREIDFVIDNIMVVAVPKLIKVIAHGDEIVGFAFGFADVSETMQRIQGRLLPFGALRLLLALRRAVGMSGNGMGILPEYQGRGGNALLYSEMYKTMKEARFAYCELTQVAETAVQMRRDLVNLGGMPYKNHRVFARDL